MSVNGTCDPRFDGIREELERNLAERGEVGASVCVTVDGETVVDLWGGLADPETQRAWEQDTICLVWSCTKGAVALANHVLASRGEIDLRAPVATYWPEFAKGGKDAITVDQALSHQAGVAAITSTALPENAFCDWDTITTALADQDPLWEPGTRHGYHGITFGHLNGEIVRRVSGRSFGTFFRDEIAHPLGIDFHVGLPEADESRVAPNIWADLPEPADMPTFYQAGLSDPTSIQFALLANNGGLMMPPFLNTRTAHAAEIPGLGGIGNARSLAGMYRPLALDGSADGVRLVSSDHHAQMGSVSASGQDAMVLVPTRWAHGFMKSCDNRHLPANDATGGSVLMSEEAYGHAGMGGSLGFADPKARVSFGYAMNKQGNGLGINDRGQALVDATYRALGYQQADGGIWFS